MFRLIMDPGSPYTGSIHKYTVTDELAALLAYTFLSGMNSSSAPR